MKAIDFLEGQNGLPTSGGSAMEFLDGLGHPPGIQSDVPRAPMPKTDIQSAWEREVADKERNQDTLLTAVKNTPGSAYQFALNIYNAIRHPVDTATAVYQTAKGGVEKLTNAEGSRPNEPKFDQMVEFFKKRYGGEDKLRNTIETDPVGFLADVSTVLTGTGGALRGSAVVAEKAGQAAATVAPAIRAAGKAASATGAAVDPVSMVVSGAINTAGKTIPGAASKLSPEALYESALKPSTTLSKEERATRVSTALENNILPNQQGLDKVRSLITQIDDEVNGIIREGPYGGNPINTDAVVQHLDQLKEFARNTVNPQEPLAIIKKVESRFLAAKGTAMSVEAAHNLKKNTYLELKKFYDKFTQNAAVEAKKALARGLKEEVYALYPELREMGKKEGALIALEESIERAANRISNRDVIGLGVPMKGAAGGIVGGPAGAVATTALGILDTPQVKARLAQALYRARKGVDSIKGTTARAAAFQAGRIDEKTE